MRQSLLILTICSMMTIGSGCSLFKDRISEPLCLPSRPVVPNISNEEKFDLWSANPTALEGLALRELRLKTHIETIEQITKEHNRQFKASCAEEL